MVGRIHSFNVFPMHYKQKFGGKSNFGISQSQKRERMWLRQMKETCQPITCHRHVYSKKKKSRRKDCIYIYIYAVLKKLHSNKVI